MASEGQGFRCPMVMADGIATGEAVFVLRWGIMSKPEATPDPRIELDFGPSGPDRDPFPRRVRQVSQDTMPALPKIEPMMQDGDVGSDEAERTVGIFFLLTALPGVLALLFSPNAGGLVGIAIPLYFGIGLLRGDEFVQQWVVAACAVQFILAPVSAFISPRSIWFILGGLAQSGGLLILVSGKVLSRQTYRLCLAGVGLGILISSVGAFFR